jgi:hypothetical protein
MSHSAHQFIAWPSAQQQTSSPPSHGASGKLDLAASQSRCGLPANPKPIAPSVDKVQIVVSEFAPFALDLAFGLLPPWSNVVPVHPRSLHRTWLMIGRNSLISLRSPINKLRRGCCLGDTPSRAALILRRLVLLTPILP